MTNQLESFLGDNYIIVRKLAKTHIKLDKTKKELADLMDKRKKLLVSIDDLIVDDYNDMFDTIKGCETVLEYLDADDVDEGYYKTKIAKYEGVINDLTKKIKDISSDKVTPTERLLKYGKDGKETYEFSYSIAEDKTKPVTIKSSIGHRIIAFAANEEYDEAYCNYEIFEMLKDIDTFINRKKTNLDWEHHENLSLRLKRFVTRMLVDRDRSYGKELLRDYNKQLTKLYEADN